MKLLVNKNTYPKAVELLHQVTTPNGFLASAENTANYNRVWARDGVICGLAALASGDDELIACFKNTLISLAQNQHKIGTIPSNVSFTENHKEISYGGLAGRVDAVTWFIIGVCQYAYYHKDMAFVAKYNAEIEKGLALLEAWEFNNKHLIYTPLSGNWADEYITDGYVLYDQLLRLWALKSYNFFAVSSVVDAKIQAIQKQIEANFFPNSNEEKFHERAFKLISSKNHLPCSFSPAGYKNYYDAFAHALAVLLQVGTTKAQNDWLNVGIEISNSTTLGLVPAFWPPVFEQNVDWNLLKNNCKYEFRNHPYEFHNGGSWPMVNGFFGMALAMNNNFEEAERLLSKLNASNSLENYSFYENFNSETGQPNGVAFCSWSAAATVLLNQSVYFNFKLLL